MNIRHLVIAVTGAAALAFSAAPAVTAAPQPPVIDLHPHAVLPHLVCGR